MKFSFIAANTNRSYVYLRHFIINKMLPNEIFFYTKKLKKNILTLINQKKIKVTIFKTNNINNKTLIEKIKKSKNHNLIFSGYPGEIVNTKILKKKIIHSHPGKLPNFKGSTTIYYSILMKRAIYCTCLQINEKIDSGKILFVKKFKLPTKINSIESNYNDEIRAKTLIAYLKSKKKNIKIKLTNKMESSFSKTYYIAHPIIRQIVLDKKKLLALKKFL